MRARGFFLLGFIFFSILSVGPRASAEDKKLYYYPTAKDRLNPLRYVYTKFSNVAKREGFELKYDYVRPEQVFPPTDSHYGVWESHLDSLLGPKNDEFTFNEEGALFFRGRPISLNFYFVKDKKKFDCTPAEISRLNQRLLLMVAMNSQRVDLSDLDLSKLGAWKLTWIPIHSLITPIEKSNILYDDFKEAIMAVLYGFREGLLDGEVTILESHLRLGRSQLAGVKFTKVNEATDERVDFNDWPKGEQELVKERWQATLKRVMAVKPLSEKIRKLCLKVYDDSGAVVVPKEPRYHSVRYLVLNAGTTLDRISEIYLDFVGLVPGMFPMGSPEEESGRKEDEWLHEVTLTEPFYMMTSLVSQKIFQSVMKVNPSRFEGEDLPVDSVTWESAQLFVKALNKLAPSENTEYALPTEAQLEYAFRAGEWGRFAFILPDDRSKEKVWTSENSDAESHPVTSSKTNPLGIHDVHGNMRQWTQDTYLTDLRELASQIDPIGGPAEGQYKVVRGGSFRESSDRSRLAVRNLELRNNNKPYIGIRLVKVFKKKTAKK